MFEQMVDGCQSPRWPGKEVAASTQVCGDFKVGRRGQTKKVTHTKSEGDEDRVSKNEDVKSIETWIVLPGSRGFTSMGVLHRPQSCSLFRFSLLSRSPFLLAPGFSSTNSSLAN